MIYMSWVATNRNYPRDPRMSIKKILVAAWKALPALFMPVLIMGVFLAVCSRPPKPQASRSSMQRLWEGFFIAG